METKQVARRCQRLLFVRHPDKLLGGAPCMGLLDSASMKTFSILILFAALLSVGCGEKDQSKSDPKPPAKSDPGPPAKSDPKSVTNPKPDPTPDPAPAPDPGRDRHRAARRPA